MAKKRVHEIAKEKGIPSKEVIAKLQAAGLNVKAAAPASTRRTSSSPSAAAEGPCRGRRGKGRGGARRVLRGPATAEPAASPPPAKPPRRRPHRQRPCWWQAARASVRPVRPVMAEGPLPRVDAVAVSSSTPRLRAARRGAAPAADAAAPPWPPAPHAMGRPDFSQQERSRRRTSSPRSSPVRPSRRSPSRSVSPLLT